MTFLATVVGTFFLSNTLSAMAFSFLFDSPRKTACIPAAFSDESDEAESGDTASDEEDEDGSATSSSNHQDSSSSDDDDSSDSDTAPKHRDMDPTVPMIDLREPEHLKML
ncbi:Aste57867_12238 [Aphanomyces stellatus]|uniref:Aste57867_12238 protein n=1 Tax=Aphanomyces stellatus TaxID=120398 RepID=A0A485KVN7_9STRA|nr:hypothetical protein As57867_012193 [Aphanomyces stellatus]VFT89092.1 Aste57867_12238 [Aphanomyces stellatus]